MGTRKGRGRGRLGDEAREGESWECGSGEREGGLGTRKGRGRPGWGRGRGEGVGQGRAALTYRASLK